MGEEIKCKVALIHPDLGIGGAERLVLDVALELSSLGYEVVMYTGYHDIHRCFEETLAGSERAHWIRVHGSWIPRHILGRFHALFANLRCLWASLAMLLSNDCDVVIVDQVSAPVMLLRMFTTMHVVFYCHYPDMLLARHDSIFRALYRIPLDFFEQVTTGMAHKVLVNSWFTADTFVRTFVPLFRGGMLPRVLYPAVNTQSVSSPVKGRSDLCGGKLFLSINRFERKKNLSLALRAYAILRENSAKNSDQEAQLILAGGYDSRLRENVEYFEELQREARELGIWREVLLLPSISAQEKEELLRDCTCVIYTPENEHFGIVPLEAMAAGKPVIACNSGGPVESIVDGITGILCEPTPEEFAVAMREVSTDPGISERMGYLARKHVERKFSRKAFGKQLQALLPLRKQVERPTLDLLLLMKIFVLFALFAFYWSS